jgi:DNA-binding FadR family transcriptional regulator
MNNSGMSFPPLTPKRTFELILDVLKEKILTGEYRIGDRLPAERDLANALGVGRPSVREAYRILELLGVLEIRKGNQGGAYIQELTHQSASQTITSLWRMKNVTLSALARSRLIIESGLVDEIVSRAEAKDLARLEEVIRHNEEALQVGRIPCRASLEMHLELARISGNPVMVMVLSSILDLMWLFLKKVRPDVDIARQDLREHRLIVNAVKARNAKRLRLLLHQHLQNSKERLENVGKDTRSLLVQPTETDRALGGL